MNENAAESIPVRIEVKTQQGVCYMDNDKYGTNAKMQQSTMECANTEFLECKANSASNCKFIDCFNQNSAIDLINPTESSREYLFSACVPRGYTREDSLQVCNVVAQGNDYTDYYLDQDDDEILVIHKWRWFSGPFVTALIVIVLIILCLFCGVVCYYNYKMYHEQERPFNVPEQCPTCLFPKPDYTQLLEKQKKQMQIVYN